MELRTVMIERGLVQTFLKTNGTYLGVVIPAKAGIQRFSTCTKVIEVTGFPLSRERRDWKAWA